MRPPLEFGLSVTPAWADTDLLLRLVSLGEEAGLDLVGIQDHPYQWRFLDTWTLIAWLAARTSRIRFFPDVVNLPLRPPAVLAKAAASLDVLSGGRVELGLGAGAFWDAIEAMGGPRRQPAAAVQATEEAIDVIRLIWSGERRQRYQGQIYRLAGVNTGPPPAHPIQIWVGAMGERMLRLIGRKADGWLPSMTRGLPQDLPDRIAVIEEAAAGASRPPGSVRRILNVAGAIEDEQSQPFVGPAAYWVDRLAHLATEVGLDTFVFWPRHDEEAQVERFATQVVPAVREAVGRPGR